MSSHGPYVGVIEQSEKLVKELESSISTILTEFNLQKYITIFEGVTKLIIDLNTSLETCYIEK